MPNPSRVSAPLLLQDDDSRVSAARCAEAALFDLYGLRPVERYLPMSFGRLRVLVFGRGEPLLLVPGNTGDVFPLSSLIALLPDRMVIAVNRPGGGLSEGMDHNTVDVRTFAVKILTAVLDAYQLRRTDVLAHSMGAQWSLWLALDQPTRVRRLITMGNPGNVMLDRLPVALALMGKAPWNRWLLALMAPRSGAGSRRLFKMLGMDKAAIARLPPELGECYYRFWQLPHYLTSSTSLLENMAPRLEAADLGRIAAYAMVIWGSRDTFAGLDKARDIAVALPHATLVDIENGSHSPWLGAEHQCAAHIRGFLSSVVPVRGA